MTEKTGIAHEIWASAQLMLGEGIEDGVKRIEGILKKGDLKMQEKTLHNSDISGAKENVKDITTVGDGDMFQLLCKASSQAEGWMKSTKAYEVHDGCIVQVTTQQRNPDGSYAVAEAVTYVRGVKIVEDKNNGRRLGRL